MKQARKDAHVKAKDVAKLAGIEPSQLSHFESGRKGLDTPLLLAVLSAADALGVDVLYVIRGARRAVDIEKRVRAIVSELHAQQLVPEASISDGGAGAFERDEEKLQKRLHSASKRGARE